MAEDLVARALTRIAQCQDPKQLRQMAASALKQGNSEVQRAAALRLYAVLPSADPGSLEYDVWRTIYALEDARRLERSKGATLTRTRQKIARDGERLAVADLVVKKESSGFSQLIELGMAEYTFEAVTVRHAKEFDPDVIEAAREKLAAAGARE